MNYYMEAPKKIPIKDEVDVLIIGGGPSGFSAAVNAARNGVKTMLIEQSGTMGGVATSGLMSHWTGGIQGGFYEEILEHSHECTNCGEDWLLHRIINPEKLKTVMLDMLYEAGVIYQLYTFACEAMMDGNKIVGVITESKSGREVILAKMVIDASGDGDIAAKAGVPFYKGQGK